MIKNFFIQQLHSYNIKMMLFMKVKGVLLPPRVIRGLNKSPYKYSDLQKPGNVRKED
jgi:hypothetical protein